MKLDPKKPTHYGIITRTKETNPKITISRIIVPSKKTIATSENKKLDLSKKFNKLHPKNSQPNKKDP